MFNFNYSLKVLFSKKCAQFLTALNQKVLQDTKKSFEDVHSNVKIY